MLEYFPVFHPISSVLTHSLLHSEFCLFQVCPCAQLCHILPQQHKPAQFQTLDLLPCLPPTPCTSTDPAALGTVKADPDADHAWPEEWAGKDRTSTAPAQTTTNLHTKVPLFVPALGNPRALLIIPLQLPPFLTVSFSQSFPRPLQH